MLLLLLACAQPTASGKADPLDSSQVTTDSAGDSERGDSATDSVDTSPDSAPDTSVDTGPVDPIGPDLPELDALIADRMQAAHVPGLAAAVTRDGELLWARGYGLADIDAGRAVTPDTVFMLASVSKTVVVAAVMQAVEDGLLDLDTDVDGYLPFPVDPAGFAHAPVTLRQLLTHTAGIHDRWPVWNDLYADGDSDIPLGTFLQGYLEEGGAWYLPTNYTDWAPGTRYEYCNIGVALAAYVVEVLRGEPFDDVCDRDIFAPLQMRDTAWHFADFDPEVVAMPYTWDGTDYVATGQYGYPDYPDGQLRASVVDLSRHLRAFGRGGELDGARILESAAVDEMRREQFPDVAQGQGLVWYAWDGWGGSWYGHSGSDSGVATDMWYRTDDGLGYLVLMNGDWNDEDAIYDVEEALIAAFSEP